ncbi:MAG: DedA family protein [Alphaproteobacteria bacterium]|nr:DedA family protein [Alphaproteobacteria bacterium]
MLGDALRAILDASSSPWWQAAAIILGTFILEDATTVLAAFEVGAGGLSPVVALCALYIGVSVGDFGLYWAGRLASVHPWIGRMVRVERVADARRWLKRNAFISVLSTRFLPGARLPTYTAFGVLRIPFARFAAPVIAGTLVWTSLLFGISLEFGSAVLSHLGRWRWLVGAVLVIGLLALGRRVSRRSTGLRAA